MASNLILADSPRARYATGATMYFAQGIPYGLMNIAIPAWLASMGVSAGQIASFLAVIVLPWAFKLLAGPMMDHYAFLPMGRRRPWVMIAQLGLTLSFFALVTITDPAEQVGRLMLLGVFINIFAASQDVAVDGMAIDLTPVEEQGRLNAFMTFGKSMGWGITAAVSGMLLVTVGLGVTAIIAAAVSGIIFLAFMLTLEHEGERRLPWSSGEATQDHHSDKSMVDLFKGLKKDLSTKVSLIVMGIMFCEGMVNGYGHALMPIAAINLFGFTPPEWSTLVATMGLVGAGVALALGPLIDRFGAKRMLFATITLIGVHAFLLAATQSLWVDATYVRVMLSIWIMLVPVTMVCMIALAMAICASVNSATQFAIFMSMANLGTSAGSKIYGLVAEATSYNQAYFLLGGLTIILITVLFFHRHRHAHQAAQSRKTAPSYSVSLGTDSGAMFFSGAMRCPKCRSDMEQLDVEGVEIDRCTRCKGLWFDAGELEALKDKKIAAEIDIADPEVGKTYNAIDRYRCPRCGGAMARMVDPLQTHIWYEQCGSCHGSYFDAGEFTDLANLSISDFFKRFTTPERR